MATGGNNAVAARTMFSGDVIMIFRGDADFRAQNTAWVTKAFGDAISIFKRKLAIFAKELFAKKLRDTYDKANLTKIFRQSNSTKITRCRRSLLRNKKNKYAALIIYISDI
jgi:hypothetical protein